MSKLRILIEEMVDKRLKELSLNEAFKSKKMHALATIKNPYHIDILGALVLFGIKASEITDDQIEVTSAVEAKSLMKQYPKGLAFIIDNDKLVAVLMNGKHVLITGSRYRYVPDEVNVYTNDPKYIRNNKDQFSTAQISISNSHPSSDQKTGMSATYRMSMSDILNPEYMCYFLKTADNAGLYIGTRYGNLDYHELMRRQYSILNKKHSEYKKKIEALRSKSRTKSFSEPIMKLIEELNQYKVKIEEVTNKLLNHKNLANIFYRISSTDFLHAYMQAGKYIIDAINIYLRGESNDKYIRYANTELRNLGIMLQQANKNID